MSGLLLSRVLPAEDVFHWVDDDGVVNFSQWAPDDARHVVKLVVDSSNPPDYDPQEDPYSIHNQAVRIKETWSALAAQRDERRVQQREESQQSVRYEPLPYDDQWRYAPLGYYGPIYPPVYPPIHRPIKPPRHLPGDRPDNRPVPQPHNLPNAVPAKPASFSPDPMRSAHIGVRNNTSQ